MNFEDVTRIREECLKHAGDLVMAAQRIRVDFPHLAYHLATLALEEIGKGQTLLMEASPSHPERAGQSLVNMRDDHVKKLFWALWGPSFGRERIDREQIEGYQGFASQTHERRLAGLYVDWHDGRLSIPRDAIPLEQAKTLVELAEARLGMEQAVELRVLDDEARLLAEWFATSNRDEEKSKLIFNRKSMDKLQELGEGQAWIRWLKEQFDEAERISKELLARELNRPEPGKEEGAAEKWRVRIRLVTSSHSIRARPLAWWNGISKYIKLYRGRDHQELLIDLSLPKAVPLDALWFASWGYSRRFVIALNIGAFGFFWWQIGKDISRFYYRIDDIEANSEVRVERVPRLSLDWGRNVLDEAALRKIAVVLRFVPGPSDQTNEEPFGHYLTGLAFLGKSDIHLQLEPNAFFHFFSSLKTAARVYGDWDGTQPFDDAATLFLERVLPSVRSWRELLQIGHAIERREEPPKEVTLSEVGAMKLTCDAYFLSVFKGMAEKEERDHIAGDENPIPGT